MIEVKENILLSQFSNYKIGGPAKYFFEAQNYPELKEAIEWAKERGEKIFILGGGTNLLISDQGFSGFVLKPNFFTLRANRTKVTVGAGVLVSDLLNLAIQKELSGLEWAGGLPGTVGGAIYGNAGAFGGEVKDSLESVESFNLKSLKGVKRINSECHFEYRSSIFKEHRGEEIITTAVFNLKKGQASKIKEAIDEKVNYRQEHQPLDYPNVGSIFKNVDAKKFRDAELTKMPDVINVIKKDPFPVVPTAYLISEAGLKGVSFGGAMISPKHPNFIVNTGNASSSDVLALIDLVKTEIKRKFKIELEEEVQIVA